MKSFHNWYLYTRYPIVARALGSAFRRARAKVSCIQIGIIVSELIGNIKSACYGNRTWVRPQQEHHNTTPPDSHVSVNSITIYVIVYKIPYRRARAWPSARASKGIMHTIYVNATV